MLKQSGFSLVELMIAIAIGLIISTALSLIFVSTTKARQEINQFGEQIENGRIAMDMLSEDLQTAGYWDGLNIYQLSAPSLLPDPCATDTATLKANIPMYVQGYDNSNGSLTCLSDVKTNTDVIVIRRAGTCAVGSTGCAAAMVTNAPYFQASQCLPPAQRSDGTSGAVAQGDELASSDAQNWYSVANTAAGLTLHKIDCANPALAGTPNFADIRPYIVHIYFVANNTEPGDGIPALKMAELGATGFTITTISSGIEELQLEYGEDTNTDGTPDVYTAAPVAAADWLKVVSVKANILSRNTSTSKGYVDNKTYALGYNAGGTANTRGPFGDAIRRHAYSSAIILSNPAGLRGS